MPCTDGREPWNVRTVPDGHVTIKKEELDLLTRVACQLATAFEDVYVEMCDINDSSNNATLVGAKFEGWITDEVFNWIIIHREKDAVRKQHLKETALAKLTDEEREALGL